MTSGTSKTNVKNAFVTLSKPWHQTTLERKNKKKRRSRKKNLRNNQNKKKKERRTKFIKSKRSKKQNRKVKESDVKHILIDVTDYTENVDLKSIDFKVKSYDENDAEIDNVFKPYFEFVTSQGTRRIKFYVNEFSSYYPELKLCNVDVSVEFLNRNGTFSTEVELEHYGTVLSPFEIVRKSNNFVYNSNTINVGYDPSCHIYVRNFSLISVVKKITFQCEAGTPVEINPCTGPDCVKVVRWDLEHLKQIYNTFDV